MIKLVDFTRQNSLLKKKLIKAFAKVIDSQAYILGKSVEDFEKSFATFNKNRYAIGVSSGFDAILLSLKAIGVNKGDEVITTANTYISTVLPIIHAGAKPVLVDVNKNSLSMDATMVEKKISARTKAIIPVHLFGLPVDMNPLLRLAKKYKLSIIEDACQAHGALYKGKPAGSLGKLGCFSFYPSKNLGAFGDGGLITTNNKLLANKIRMLRNVGQQEKNVHKLIGYNSRLDAVQATLLQVKLPYLKNWIKQRRKIASYYSEQLKNLPLILPNDTSYAQSSYHLYAIRTKNRDELKEFLQKNGVHSEIHYPTPVHLQFSMRKLGYKKGDFPVSEQSSRELLSLPLYPEISLKEVEKICSLIKRFYVRY
jgi:dTDP-4-amino-4,6-dideoxygalactose transaminase